MRTKKIRWPEQLDNPPFRRAGMGVKRWLKKVMRRSKRRDGKLNGDDALKTNRYRGWES